MRVVGFFLAAMAVASAAPVLFSENGELIEGEWIVVFHNNATDAMIKDHMVGFEKFGLTQEAVMWQYHMGEGEFKGYSLKATQEQIYQISEMNDVKYIEQNIVMRAIGGEHLNEVTEDAEDLNCGTRSVVAGLWGLARISQPGPVGATRTHRRWSTSGSGVNLYICDTGIRLTHQDWGSSRARHVFDATGEGPGDGHGHGTHCTGTAGGNQYGQANSATLLDVKVLSRSGSGSTAGVIAGVNHIANASGRRVGSMSLGGGRSAAMNDAVDSAYNRGAVMVVASGNSNANACNFSPASAAQAVTVNSMQNNDARSSFSNFGTCTHVFAPGTSVLSAWSTSDTATNTISGTSMACPHVAGVAAEIWGRNPTWSAAQVRAAARSGASGRISNPGTGSPNIMSQNSCAQ